jgi:hypothetical protein
MSSITLHLGLDVHKRLTPSPLPTRSKGEIRIFETITNVLQALEKVLTRIRKTHPGAQLKVAYEAGPCGFGIARRLKQLDVPCVIATPSLIPKQPGSPFKTDKRDARTIPRLPRAGDLTAVYIPEPPMRPFATCAVLAPTPLTTSAALASASKRSSCVTITATKAKPTGANLTCATCANWSFPTPL